MKRFTQQQIEDMETELQTCTFRELAERHKCSIQVLQYYIKRKPEDVKTKCIEPGCKEMVSSRSKTKLCKSCYMAYFNRARKAVRGEK